MSQNTPFSASTQAGALQGDAASQLIADVGRGGGAETLYAQARTAAERRVQRARDQAEDLLGDVETAVRANPVTVATGALLVGLLAGLLLGSGRNVVYVRDS